MSDDIFDVFLAIQRQARRAPPVIDRIYATHRVPYGRVYRMWTAHGELIAYVNRGEIADMPRARTGWQDSSLACLTGIPVVFE